MDNIPSWLENVYTRKSIFVLEIIVIIRYE